MKVIIFYHLLKEKKRTVKVSSIEKSFLSADEVEILQTSNADLLLPIIYKENLLGVFLIGECRNSSGYIYDDIYFFKFNTIIFLALFFLDY